ncbi:SbcC/MukB-like Walker B domain-containing protein [Flexithrix dorotheae]|uniref:SbcC/MukB-like Walker B domain-containing protein n=1 Tax=Flexithrix dorotheae TaxID=70993 RepID=UPI000371EDC3|nr:SbcC/MukB-like Walker B domain-containing protein [Flexithrix dorotheae]
MIPISLTLEGLYSYKGKQTIDFTQLISNNLFGIFGQVGSGKSSILEAMMFAIYGETDRLNSRGDDRNYNMMNLQSDRLLIDFECFAGKNGREIYRFVYETKRNSKNFNDVKPPVRRVLKKDGENWLPLEKWDAQEIIGMSAKNFKQTIIIPQGKFKEFIELGATDRTKMLQELFQLDKFDLSDKTRGLFTQNKENLIATSSRLESYEEYTQELLKEKTEHLKVLESEKSELEKALKEKQALVNAQKALQDLFLEKRENEQQFEKLAAQQEKVNALEVHLSQLDKAERLFRDKLENIKKTRNDIERKDSTILSIASEKNRIGKDLENAKSNFEQAKKDFDEKDKIKAKFEDLGIIINLKEEKEKLGKVEEKLQAVGQKLEGQKKELANQEKIQEEDQEKRKSLRTKSGDISQLKDAENWFLTNVNLSDLVAKNKQLLAESGQKLEKIKGKKETILEKAQMKDFVDKPFEEILGELKKRKNDITQQQIDFEISQKFLEARNDLEAGKPCPVCGATTHPLNIHEENAENRPKENADSFALKIKEIDETERAIVQLSNEFSLNHQLREERKESLNTAQLDLDKHEEKFDFSGVEKSDFEKIQNQIKAHNALQKSIEEVESKLEDTEKLVKHLQKEIETLQHGFNHQEKEKSVLEASIKKDLASLKILEFEKYQAYPIEKLAKSRENGEQLIERIESTYEKTNALVSQLEKAESAKTGQLYAEQENLKELRGQLKSLEELLEKTIAESEFEGLDEIHQLLQSQLDVELERKRIEEFKSLVQEVRLKLKSVKEKIGDQEFNEEEFEKGERELRELDAKKLALEQNLAVIKKEMDNARVKIAEKEKLQQEETRLKLRAENLKTLSDLFRSKGFVEYVSSIYLQNLVENANQRFMRLTKNTLSLELNEKYDFIVRDFLNNGRTRLLKTLSGGQTFQAALCLALALAENVKSLNQSEESFFFLDEGFGTLDKTSLNIVFETLRELKKENRIVGVISHVEELQQEIDVAIHVNNDQEKGSIIQYSWKS